MGKYDSRLSSMTNAEIIARLEGTRGLLALSSRELFFLDDTSNQTADLSNIKRIGVNKQSGNVDVSGEHGSLMQIPPTAFQKDELKLFLESLKGHVMRAKTEVVDPIEASPPPPPVAEPEPLPEPEPVSSAFDDDPFPAQEPTFNLPTHNPTFTPEATPMPDLEPPRAFVQENPSLNIIDPTKTIPEDPNSIWAYEGGAQPVSVSQEHTPAPGRVSKLDNTTEDDLDTPVAPAAVSTPAVVRTSSTQRTGFFLLKIWSLVTLLFSLAYMGLNLLNPSGTDAMVSALVLVGGVALALLQWRLSEPL